MVKQSMHKAVVALLSGLVTVLGIIFGVDFTEEYGIGTEEIASIGTIVTTFLVWYVPNRPKE